MGFFEKLQAKIELYRLEQRYTRNRNRRSTFISNATYVDGEYIYNTPNTTGSSNYSSAASSPIDEEDVRDLGHQHQQQQQQQQQRRRRSVEISPSSPTFNTEPQTPAERKRLHRFSSMPGFGSLSKSSGRDWRSNAAADVREER